MRLKPIKIMENKGKKPDGKFKKGHNYGKGRPKGSKNKFTSLQDEFLKAFNDKDGIGGAEGIKDLIKDNKKNKMVFLQMITKMLPTNVDLGGNANILFRVIYDPEAKDK